MKKIIEKINLISNKPLFLALLFYFLAFGLILFNRGIYWDDWTLFYVSSHGIIEEFSQVGVWFWGYVHIFFTSFAYGIVIFKFLIFILYFLSGLFLNEIIKKVKEIDAYSRFIIVVFFLLFPVNFARIALIDFPYCISYFLFFLAFFLTVKYFENKKIIFRIISQILFLISFVTNSIVLFFLIVLFYIFYVVKNEVNGKNNIIKKLLKYIDYFLLPLIFWPIKNIFFTPNGIYENYKNIDLSKPANIIFDCMDTVESSFTDILKQFFVFLYSYPIYAIIFALIIYFLIDKTLITKKSQNLSMDNRDFYFFVFGISAFLLAILPYILVHAIPTANEWTSRHQLLVPLGASFMLYYGVKIIFAYFRKYFPFNRINYEIVQKYFYSLLILFFIYYNFTHYSDFQRDWFKQLSLIDKFKTSETLEKNTSFLFTDNTENYNAILRTYRFYEYNGLMKYVFKDSKRFGSNKKTFSNINDYIINTKYEAYNMTQFDLKSPEYEVIIEPGSFILSGKATLQLMYWQIFNKQKFKENISSSIELKYIKIE